MEYIQYIIVALIVLSAFAFAARSMFRQTRSFSKKAGCGDDCGCSSGTKKARV